MGDLRMEKLYFPPLKNAPLLTAWSYSRYNDYATCPMMFAYKHLLRVKETTKSPAMERGIDIHREGEEFLVAPKKPKKVPASYANFADEMAQLRDMSPTVEQQWGFRQDWTPATATARDPHGWFAKDVWLRNVLDVCVVYPDDTALVIDFKTGKKYGTNEDQMQLFALATFNKFPQLTEVSTRLWYLDIDDIKENEVESEFVAKEVPALKKDWERKVKPMFLDRKFPPRPNPKCKWCHVSKSKGGPCKF
jgi:hypothetical protein